MSPRRQDPPTGSRSDRPVPACRGDFPQLTTPDPTLPRAPIYLDSAATSLKPQVVIDALSNHYQRNVAGVHRAVHEPGERATQAFEAARARVARFIGAAENEIAFTRSATESLNLLARSLTPRGVVAVPVSEHHANWLPWNVVQGASLALRLTADGNLDLPAAGAAIRSTRPIAITVSAVNNVTGLHAPLDELRALAREVGAWLIVDLSQAVGHEPIDVGALACDAAAFSAHKMFGPEGVGVLFARAQLTRELAPLLLGGSMVRSVRIDGFEALPFPHNLEAGSPNVAGAVGLAAACDYLDSIGVDRIRAHTATLAARLAQGLAAIDGIALTRGAPRNPSANFGSIVSFHHRDLDAHTIARVLSSRFQICVRSGYHCAQPLHEACGWPETVRASLHAYNTADEVDAMIDAVGQICRLT
ncbi:MAG: aminotransferase class V-fold PLP-dependent enzyme [Phycisphaerae bacterium]|nr:aminotransferase class V-fold PLP-dependent enzyme [Phycisphaerae bacterium]